MIILFLEGPIDRAFRGNTQPTEDPNLRQLWQNIEK
jgi:hypothetical protein